jgi:hypothetical protein
MNQIYLVYKTDANHSYASRDIIGVATNKQDAIFLCYQQAQKEGETIDQEQLHNLENLKQTQGYSGKGEFDFETVKTNTLL